MGISVEPTIPYWQVNVPVDERSVECPIYLQNVNEKDRKILSTPDAEYHKLSWAEVCSLISENRLDLFQRIPSDLRRYLEYNYKLKQEYGSVMEFVLTHKLGWVLPVEAEGPPLKNPDDLQIKWNDWPYGIDENIVHLVVWTKFELEEDLNTGDLTKTSRREICDFVDETFCRHLGNENVIWFKNWRSLKSVHAVEHFHVMLHNPDPEFVRSLTNGDIPLFKNV